MVRWDSLWVNVQAATMAPAGDGADPYGTIPDAAIAVAADAFAAALATHGDGTSLEVEALVGVGRVP